MEAFWMPRVLCRSVLEGFCSDCELARGSQRERDREGLKPEPEAKQISEGLTPEQRRERDAKALQEKAAKKAAQAAAAASSGGGGKGNNKKKL